MSILIFKDIMWNYFKEKNKSQFEYIREYILSSSKYVLVVKENISDKVISHIAEVKGFKLLKCDIRIKPRYNDMTFCDYK
jgi:hypothetical protein